MSEVKVVYEKGIYFTSYLHGLCRIKKEYVDPVSKEKILEGDARAFGEYSWTQVRWNSGGRVICGKNDCDLGKKFELSADDITEQFMTLKYESRSQGDTVRYLQQRVADLEDFKAHLEKPTWLKKLRAKLKRR